VWFLYSTLTGWLNSTPVELEARLSDTAVCLEDHLHLVTLAGQGRWQGVATGLGHQGRPVPLQDGQVVIGTGAALLNFKSCEFYRDGLSLLHFNACCLVIVVRVSSRMIW